MNTTRIAAAAASVIGSRHLRAARNGQDAAIAWLGAVTDGDAATRQQGLAGAGGPDVGVVVVCDGCSSGASSEVGARLGAMLFARQLAARLCAGERPSSAALWQRVREGVVRALAELVERMPGDREAAIGEHLLFTIVAAAATRDDAAVWALGDGAYSFGDGTHVLGPFDDNAPPYLAYDLLGDPREAHVALAPANATAIVVGTDGATELESGLECFTAARFVEHPDALRRELAVLARVHERIDWDERRVVRTPARLQDDCAIGVLHRRRP